MNFTSNSGHCPVFSFTGTLWYCSLLLWFPREFPRCTLKSVTDCLELLQVPQSLSQKAMRWVELLEEKNKPRLGAPLIYLKILIAALWWAICRLIKKQRKLLNKKCDVRSGISEIHKPSNQPSIDMNISKRHTFSRRQFNKIIHRSNCRFAG